jgi:murein DD-endopeptidase MepM/ murein hydrolase activator NlpD
LFWSRIESSEQWPASVDAAAPIVSANSPKTHGKFGHFHHDLAEDIGSKPWFRGFAAMSGLILVSTLLYPGISPVEAASAMRLDNAGRDELRSLALMPLSQGGATGHITQLGASAHKIGFAPERKQVSLTATLGQGDNLAQLLYRAGASPLDAAQLSAVVAHAVPLAELTPGTRVNVALGQRKSPQEARQLSKVSLRAKFDLGLDVVRQGSDLKLIMRPIATNDLPLRIRGTVGTSLYRSARAAGAPIRAIQQYIQAIDAHFSLDEVKPGDKFDLILSYKRSTAGESQAGDLLYAGLEQGGKPRAQLLRWAGGKNDITTASTGIAGQFFDAASMSESHSSSLIQPVAGRLTSNYGMRMHPVLGYARMHAGMDFGAAYGSPIYAVADALVTYSGVHGGHGNYVRLDHGGGLGTGYGHMSQIAVANGTRVRAGQVIGYVGSTGLATGPHLHYEVYRSGQIVDPASVHFVVRAGVDKAELTAFRAKLAKLMAVKPGAALAAYDGANTTILR